MTLDERYLRWLYKQIANPRFRSPKRTYWEFARQLYKKEFHWFIPWDDNRLADGKDLRHDFLREEDISDEEAEHWIGLGCSMLEMLVALSRRLVFWAGGHPTDKFWVLVTNAEIPECTDWHYRHDPTLEPLVDDILERIIWRTYAHDGSGGLFPLRDPKRDQRTIELWSQMSDWVYETEGL